MLEGFPSTQLKPILRPRTELRSGLPIILFDTAIRFDQWVVGQDEVAKCPLFASAAEISRFQVDRTRATWVLFDMTQALQIK